MAHLDPDFPAETAAVATIPAAKLLFAYAHGVFPMGESKDSDVIQWVEPELRGIMPLDERFHMPRKVLARMRNTPYDIRVNTNFEAVMRACADRDDTWINEGIVQSYLALHRMGYAHSTEVWLDGELVGGQYGVALGRAFFGESMFHRAPDADKVALYHTWQRLRANGFLLWDTQFLTPHLARFGGYEMPQPDYLDLLAQAIV